MTGTVKKVGRLGGICSAVIHQPEPPPDGTDVELLDIPTWAYEDLRAALVGKLPVEVTQEPGTGAVLGVKIG